jgi:hypothetical protein
MLMFLEQSCTLFSKSFWLGLVFLGEFCWLLRLLGSLSWLLSAYRVIGSCVIVEFLGELISCHFSHLLSLHSGLGSHFLVSFLACLLVLAVGSS